jgi:hypothetical protein
MKNFTTLFTAILMVFAMTAFANDDAKVYNGTITLENGETLTGQIQMLSPTMNEVKVKFIDANGKKTTYKAKEVAAYSFEFPKYDHKTKTYNNEVIEYVKKAVAVSPIPFGPKEILVERQAEGTISLYNFYAETRQATHAYAHNYFVEKDGQMIEMNRENFKTILKDMVADYPELRAKVGKKGYGYKYVAKIVTEFNDYAAPKTEMFGMNEVAPF